MKHRHHIIPTHMGGTDDPSNIVYLTVEEHAKAHWELYRKHGNEFDRIAASGLEGIISHKEAVRLKLVESGKIGGKKGSVATLKKYPDHMKNMAKKSGAKQGPRNAISGLLHRNNTTKFISMLDGKITSKAKTGYWNNRHPEYIGTWIQL